MKVLALLIPLVVIGCSDKNPNLKNRDIQYQRFLHFQADKTL
jgi:hypothetical protein